MDKLFGMTLGVLFFDEQLTFAMVLGSGLIVISGLFYPLAKQANENLRTALTKRLLLKFRNREFASSFTYCWIKKLVE
ncbi:MAG: drug/metabolite transporter (DMT)-like permease [Porticoccaceae bacterium]|jgi:drug/metabolite transporter (DMT)-like permease|tara:strand:+ start:1125 stop:1358 length:234 start_codon:yes stop_codon:yes gene_type:complete